MSSGESRGPSEPPLPSQAEAVSDRGAVCRDSRAVQAERGCRTAHAASPPQPAGVCIRLAPSHRRSQDSLRVVTPRRTHLPRGARPGLAPPGSLCPGLQTPRAALAPSAASQACSPAGLKALFLLPCRLRRSLQLGCEALLQMSAALIDCLASKGGRERQFKLLSCPKQTD